MDTARTQGFSPERLKRIDAFLRDRYVASGRLPGLQVLIARNGQPVHQILLGQRDIERGLPCEEDTVFRIYSMTKPITAVALMSLVEEGAIALDDPVSKYIPAFADLKVFKSGVLGAFVGEPPSRTMQVIDLLRHTSGLTYGFQDRTNVDAAYRDLGLDGVHGDLDLDAFVGVLSTLPLEFSPGEAWNYSVSTDVAGHVVALAAGKPLDQVLRERIFEPLKMTETGFHVREEQRARFAACYTATPEGRLKLQDDPGASEFLKPPQLLAGGGGLVSTAGDYLRFANMLAGEGELDGVRILAPRTVRLMASNHLPGGGDLTQMSRSMFSESLYAGVGFGLGFAVVIDPVKTMLPSSHGEFYWGGMASTAFWVDPVERISVVLMTQFMPSSAYPIRRELRTLVYSALTG